jgi:hypothetical protein
MLLTAVTAAAQGTPVRVADGQDATQGRISDTAVTGDTAGTEAAKLRGLNKIITLVWDNVNNRINVQIQGTIALPTGASTSALQTTGNSSLSSIDTKTLAAGQATMAASSPVVIASNQSAVAVSGTVTATGPLTDTQLRATPVPVSGTVTANAGSGTLAVSGPLTDTQLRATPVPVSGTVTSNQGTANVTPWNENIAQIAGAVPSVTNTLPIRQSDGTGFLKSDVIAGNRYLGVSVVQDIEVSASNSSTTNIASAASFTGTSQTTLGAGAIQIVLFADQNATIQVQQSQEDPGVNWNVVDSWTYTANSTGVDAARTIQAVGSSMRTIVTNNGGSTTTVFRLQTVICPVCDALPRGLTQLGNLKAAITEALPVGANVIGALTANQSVNVAQIGATNTVTAAAGVQKVGIVGNANGALDAANNAALPANVVMAGVQTIAQGTQPTAATANNARYILASTEGVQYVQEGNSNRFSCFVASTATVTTQCQAAPAAGLRAYITSVTITNAVGTAQSVDVVFGTGAACVTGTTALTNKVFFVGATQQGSLNQSMTFPTPLVPTAANAICLRPTAATAFGATITGYIAP